MVSQLLAHETGMYGRDLEGVFRYITAKLVGAVRQKQHDMIICRFFKMSIYCTDIHKETVLFLGLPQLS